MRLEDLRECVQKGLDSVKQEKTELEVFASWNELITMRLNYTSDIPSGGLQEPKSSQFSGIAVSSAFGDKGKTSLGFGSQANELRPRGVKEAFRKARRGRFYDPDFRSLPSPAGSPTLVDYHDPAILGISDEEAVDLGWKALEGALRTFQEAGIKESIIVGGDVCILKELVAIKSTTGIDTFDVSTILTAAITTMVEKEGVKGTGWATSTKLAGFDPVLAGREAALSAIRTIGGKRLPPGRYEVVFGSQPITDMMANVIAPSLSLATVNASNTPFLGKLGQRVTAPNLNIYDDGSLPGQIGSKKVTCEGLPTGRTDLVQEGNLVGFLANHYLGKKFSSNVATFVPRNGFRFHGLGRTYEMQAGVFPTNLVLEGRQGVSAEELFRGIREGVYIGRIWYTYPINGLAAGDFTSTVIGDSFLIKDGQISTPLKPNAVRINDNINRVLQNIVSVGREKKAIQVWSAEEAVIAPEIRVEGVRLDSISAGTA
ncbi:MAG TPA: TldD/PmbA family protein [Candidatus Tripitaka californicus]|uniref:TldD/PmbA family protein n=1 Tax=Candidatus Tripitaka californicus TaxID=3367616 RepID=UPI004027903D|nr:TldD/PmbA family protein [Planctomycetota bacterium]